MQQKCDECVQTLYPAGERVPPGLYQHTESDHQVYLEKAALEQKRKNCSSQSAV